MGNPGRCRTCLAEGDFARIDVREMMYGSGESFAYALCQTCESLQIVDIPGDLSRHYPAGYYSMDGQQPGLLTALKLFARAQGDRAAFGFANLLGMAMLKRRPLQPEVAALVRARPAQDARILDVGCGAAAHFLRQLARAGFTSLTGADPFIEPDRIAHGRVTIHKADLWGMAGPFDVVTLNHSFEHMPDPRAALQQVAQLLAPGGRAVLCLPTPSSKAFAEYGADWVQLDAPRHLNLPSRKGMAILAETCGLELVESWDDASPFQFIGSEFYRRGIALVDQDPAMLEEAERVRFARMTEAANAAGEGDQAVWILRKAG